MALWNVNSAFVHHESYIIVIVCVVLEKGNFYDTNQGFSFSFESDFIGAPYPPTNLAVTDCLSRSTTLSWVTGAANNASITRLIIEQESAYEPNVFYPIQNVTKPNATSITFNLTGWTTLRFRLRAVNRFGPSRASVATTENCVTEVGREFFFGF